ncbi:ribonuclease J [Candidatus Wolfebacteria bacterium]|nr:ribonuclease J [Candidatus Wolfebacteria bacterium]
MGPTHHAKGFSSARAVSHPDALRFCALGGLEEVGRNMMFFEYKDEIVIIDVGFQFPEEDTPGVDYIVPNTAYLEGKKQNIKAIILTHAHLDHVGAIPYLMQKIGNPPIYTTALTKEIVVKRQEEFHNAPKLDIEVIKNKQIVQISKYFTAEFFGVAHNIPDTTGFILKTPIGNTVHFADMKFDYDKDDNPLGLDEYERIGKMDVTALFLDSTNAERPGHAITERTVEKNLEELFRKAQGRIIIGIFASLLTRIAEIIKIAERLDRKIVISGLSMKTNVQISQNLGYIKIKKGTLISLEEIHKYPDKQILILSTGAQGEPNSSLTKVANGENRFIEIRPGDTVMFSSSVIPGNEMAVQILKDNITRQGAKVYHSALVDIHSSGHAYSEELKTLIKLIKPKYLVPIHGFYFMRAANAELGREMKIPKENLLLVDNGQVVEFHKDGSALATDESVPAYYVMVDGLGVGDVGEVVMRDRKVLAQEGMIVIIATLDRRTGHFLKNPDIISRGFIYLKENKELVEEVRRRIKNIIGRIPRYQAMEPDYAKGLIRDQIGQFIFTKTKRRPMILPVVIEV